MDFSKQNNIDREFFKKDFSDVNVLLQKVRDAFVLDVEVSLDGLSLDGLIDFNNRFSYVYITLFQEGQTPIRWGACRQTLEETINRDIVQIKSNKSFSNFDVANQAKCRIMLEYITEQIPVKLEEIKTASLEDKRFEPGISGLKLNYEGKTYIYTPSEAWSNSQMDLKSALNTILRKTPIKNITII